MPSTDSNTGPKKAAKKTQPDSGPSEAKAQDKAAADGDLTVNEAVQLQFPATAGHEGVEIAARSQDVDAKTASRHEKVFVIPRNPLDDDYSGDEYATTHAANIDAMRQQAINQGLRPTSDGEFVGAENVEQDGPHGVEVDENSIGLRYAVEVAPVSVATPAEQAVRVTVEDNRRLDEQTDDTQEHR